MFQFPCPGADDGVLLEVTDEQRRCGEVQGAGLLPPGGELLHRGDALGVLRQLIDQGGHCRASLRECGWYVLYARNDMTIKRWTPYFEGPG